MKLRISTIAQAVATTANTSTHRIVVADCSGSMYHELAKLRAHLKNKLPTLVQPNDSLSLLWFSGRDEFGIIFEDVMISSLTDLSNIHKAIDRFLTPMGLTGFTQPLQEVKRVIERSKRDSATLSFMTDGYDNQGRRSDILDAAAQLADHVASATFVEYGYYANHELLVEMADVVSGTVVLAENFERYTETLNDAMNGSYGKRIAVEAHDVAADDFNFVVGTNGHNFIVGVPKAGQLSFPSDVVAYAHFVDGGGDGITIEGDVRQACFVVAALIQRGMLDAALMLAAAIGDRALYKSIENAFSKQDYGRAVALAVKIGSSADLLYADSGRQTNLQPDPNAYNVLELLFDLSGGSGNLLNVSHPEFDYNPLGGHRPTAAINESGFVPVFTDKSTQVLGEISTLKFAEDRPNVSILTRRDGLVSLPPNNIPGLSDEIVESFVWRNYAIIADGIVNVSKLPVIISAETFAKLRDERKLFPAKARHQKDVTYVIDVSGMPVMNRAMATPTTLTELFTTQHKLLQAECLMKVAKLRVEKPAFSAAFAEKYGEEGATLLKECGVTPGGFSPRTEKAEAIDARLAKFAIVSLAGFSTIPSVGEVRDKVALGKSLPPSAQALANAINIIDEIEDEDIPAAIEDTKATIANLRNKLVMMKFGIILGKRLPTDMIDLEDTTREMDFGYTKLIKCQLKLVEKEI